MEILASHWHCIIPAAVILLAMVFMQIKDRNNKTQDDRSDYKKTDD